MTSREIQELEMLLLDTKLSKFEIISPYFFLRFLIAYFFQ